MIPLTRRHALFALAAAPLARAEDGFTPLFDGSSLKGWSVQNGPESAFYVNDGAIVIHEGANFPTWLRFDRRFENFDFRCEFFIKGWNNGGIYLCAPEHGRPTWTGMKINLFQKRDEQPIAESIGSIFPIVPPLKVNVKNQGEWNTMRVLLDWPSLQVWINDEQVQKLNVESVPELRHRLRSGYIGIESLSYPLRFRNLRVRELPAKEKWEPLYFGPEHMSKWKALDEKARWEPLGTVLRANGNGYLATLEKYRDFEFHCYIRGSRHHNGGIIFRGNSVKSMEHYEIQLHDVEGAVYPTGSLYHYKRATYPVIEAEQWYPFSLYVKDRECIVRVNGDTVVEYDKLEKMEAGPIMLQAHQAGKWIEYKEVKVKRI
jgi:hypothetical protein